MHYAPLTVAPEQQKQQTLHVLTILLCIAAQRPVLFVMEEPHWVDPFSKHDLLLTLPTIPRYL